MIKWNVYISSTFKDLRELRADLINLFQNQLQNQFELSHIMERMFDDGTHTPFVEDCVEAVLTCDIYLIILGNKVGSFPPNESRTYTEIELDTALNNNKRIFCLRLDAFDTNEIDNPEKHQELLNKFVGKPIHRFSDILTLKNGLFEFLFPFASQSPIIDKNPYKGLAAFKVEDGDYFFGRSEELETCLKKIVTSSGNFFISVVGNSGTGKSSFVQAGILFKLKNEEALGFSNRHQIIVTPGSQPFTNLKYQLQLQGFSTTDLTSANDSTDEFILFFDQFEEVITQSHSEAAQAERKSFFNLLDTLVTNENAHLRILVICTFRSDFLSQLANYDFIKSHQYIFPISSLDHKVHVGNWEQSMTEIIRRPALKNGVIIEKELVSQLLNQIKEVEGSLPILQFTLERIWTRETIQDRKITTTEYSELSEGKGISGIIETHAESVYKRISQHGKNKEKEAILKGILINLVEVNEDQNDVKRTMVKTDLFSILKQYPKTKVEQVFEQLVSKQSRLLNLTQDKDETINVTIIHEVLIRKWERLKTWINERRSALEYKKRITLDIAAVNKGEEGYYDKKQIKRANQWKKDNPDLVDQEIDDFLDASRKQNSYGLLKVSGLSILVLGIIATVFYLWYQPMMERRSLLELIEKNNKSLNNKIQIEGGLDSIKVLFIDAINYPLLNGNLKHFKNLTKITIYSVSNLRDLSILKDIKNPSFNALDILLDDNLPSLAGIENLTNLDSLSITAHDHLINLAGIENLSNLKSLTLNSFGFLKNLKQFESLDKLQSLSIMHVDSLPSLAGIEKFTNLKLLYFKSNDGLEYLEGIEDLNKLQSLTIDSNLDLKNIENIRELTNLKSLTLESIYPLTNLETLTKLTKLQSLDLRRNLLLSSLNGIEKLTNLKHLSIQRNGALINLAGIEKLKRLHSLSIKANYKLTNLVGIEGLRSLNSLFIEDNGATNSFIHFEKLDSLKMLSLNRFDNLKNLNGIENMTKLDTLEIRFLPILENLKPIEKLGSLKVLSLYNNYSLTNLMGIEQLHQLEHLDIRESKTLSDLTGIQKLKSLKNLDLIDCKEVDLNPLYQLNHLKSLFISSSNELDLPKMKQNNPGLFIQEIPFW